MIDTFKERQNRINELRKIYLAENSIPETKHSKPEETSFSKSLYETLYDGYTDEDFVNKIKFDDYLYEEITKKIPEQYKNIVENKLKDIVLQSRILYESLDIRPRSYYYKESDMYKSIQENEDKSIDIINNWFNREYFNLTDDEVEKRYYQKTTDMVSLLNEDVNLMESFKTDKVDDSEIVDNLFEHSINAIIYNNLISSIIIPSVVQTKIDMVISESEFTNDIIDFETISESYDLLKKNIFEVSRLIVELSKEQ